ncbi:MAG TPA: glycyl-radical enzyme activating protein [Desulfotignum sp.]|nr:glycyl-radical enzyme activating protein [Desulfotignum sp.]
MPISGRILRIEKLSSFDGEGLRTVIFLKGCSLSCQWCSTPESQRSGTDFGVDRSKCTGCFSCVEACPENALAWDMKTGQFMIDRSLCTGCRTCVTACPQGARQAWGYTADTDDIFREVEKDSLFYFHSGGGVTLSGGEPLLQPQFCAELLEKCLAHGISTAVETCGQVPWEHMKTVLPFIDTLFFDVKHLDATIHRQLTSAGNDRILDNLARVDGAGHALSLVVRMPVVPGCNDTEDNIRALGTLCSKLENLHEIQLLPYHRLGIETYRRLSVPYALEDIQAPVAVFMTNCRTILEQMGLQVKVGG